CWEIKPVFAMPCATCGRRPRDELEFVYSIAFSSFYHDDASLEQASRILKSGSPPEMSPDQIDNLRPAARAMAERMSEIFKSIKSIEKDGSLPLEGVPAHPRVPDVGYAQATRMFRGGNYTVVFARNVKTLAERKPGTFSTGHYKYAGAAADMTTGRPVFF